MTPPMGTGCPPAGPVPSGVARSGRLTILIQRVSPGRGPLAMILCAGVGTAPLERVALARSTGVAPVAEKTKTQARRLCYGRMPTALRVLGPLAYRPVPLGCRFTREVPGMMTF